VKNHSFKLIATVLLVVMVAATFFGGCAEPTPAPATTPAPTATPEPEPTPTSEPTPTITPEPEPEPEPTQEPEPTSFPGSDAPTYSGDVAIEFISITSPCPVNETITIEIKTSPGAECKLVMTLANGDVSGFPKEADMTADGEGKAVWEWDLFRYTPVGQTMIEITATADGKTGTAVGYFEAKP
jgi:hypothetical protein